MTWVVISGGKGWHVQSLQAAAVRRGLDLAWCDFATASASDGPLSGVLDTAEVVLPRTLPGGSLEQVIFRMDLLHRALERGARVINPPRALEACVDKYLATSRMAAAGLPVPATRVCQTTDQALEAFRELGGDVVVKPLFGSEGRGMLRVEDPDLAWRVFSALERQQAVIYLQRFVKHPGWDLRVFTLGDRVLAGMRRFGNGSWRTNVAQGGRAEAMVVPETARQLALRASQVLGAAIGGVDLLLDEEGHWQLIEVNACPGWRALESATGIDVAGSILEYVWETMP